MNPSEREVNALHPVVVSPILDPFPANRKELDSLASRLRDELEGTEASEPDLQADLLELLPEGLRSVFLEEIQKQTTPAQ